MANQEGFKEGVESYRRRIITELAFMNSNIDGFVDKRNMKFELKYLVRNYRRSLEKCNLYLSEIEVLIENGDDTTNAADSIENAERLTVPGREGI